MNTVRKYWESTVIAGRVRKHLAGNRIEYQTNIHLPDNVRMILAQSVYVRQCDSDENVFEMIVFVSSRLIPLIPTRVSWHPDFRDSSLFASENVSTCLKYSITIYIEVGVFIGPMLQLSLENCAFPRIALRIVKIKYVFKSIPKSNFLRGFSQYSSSFD